MASLKTTFTVPGTPSAIGSQGAIQDESGWPDESDVTLGLVYGPSLEFTGTKSAALTLPDAGEVLDGVDRGDGVLGTRVDAPVALVLDGTLYGADGTSLVGTLAQPGANVDGVPDLNVPSLLRTLLLQSALLNGRLARYDFGSGDETAILTNDRYLYLARRPLIHIEQEGIFGGEGDRSGREYTTRGKVTLWGNRLASDAELIGLANEVWGSLDRASISVTGFTDVDLRVASPDRVVDNVFPGYEIDWEFDLMEN